MKKWIIAVPITVWIKRKISATDDDAAQDIADGFDREHFQPELSFNGNISPPEGAMFSFNEPGFDRLTLDVDEES